MSSHILTEVDRLATRIGIIHRGSLIEELDAQGIEALRTSRLQVQARDMKLARKTLTEAGYSAQFVDGMLVLDDVRATHAPEDVAALLVRAGAPPTRLAVEQEDLESHFLRLIGKSG